MKFPVFCLLAGNLGFQRRVRSRLPPPAVSPSLRGPADAGGQSRGCGAGLGLVRDVRKGRAGYDQTSFGPVSLTGSEAFPLRARLIRGFSRSPSMPALASSRL
jgi:hypothetical protein